MKWLVCILRDVAITNLRCMCGLRGIWFRYKTCEKPTRERNRIVRYNCYGAVLQSLLSLPHVRFYVNNRSNYSFALLGSLKWNLGSGKL